MQSACYFSLHLNALAVSTFFFFNDTATTEIYTLSLHDALPIFISACGGRLSRATPGAPGVSRFCFSSTVRDRKSTRLNSSHLVISYHVFCLKIKPPSSTLPRGRLRP